MPEPEGLKNLGRKLNDDSFEGEKESCRFLCYSFCIGLLCRCFYSMCSVISCSCSRELSILLFSRASSSLSSIFTKVPSALSGFYFWLLWEENTSVFEVTRFFKEGRAPRSIGTSACSKADSWAPKEIYDSFFVFRSFWLLGLAFIAGLLL